MLIQKCGKTVEAIPGINTTYYIVPIFENGRKHYFQCKAEHSGYITDFVSTYARCRVKVEEAIADEKRFEKIAKEYDIKGAISREDVSSDYFIVESELEDPFALNKKKQGLVFERIERERCEG